MSNGMPDIERGAERVVIERGGIGFIISDEGGEFARTTTIDAAITYAANLLHGPGTGAHVVMETYPSLMADAVRKEAPKAEGANKSAPSWVPRSWLDLDAS